MTWEEFCKGMHEEPPEEWHGAFERLSHKEVIALTFAARIAQTEVSLKAFADELKCRMRTNGIDQNDRNVRLIEIIDEEIDRLLHEAGAKE